VIQSKKVEMVLVDAVEAVVVVMVLVGVEKVVVVNSVEVCSAKEGGDWGLEKVVAVEVGEDCTELVEVIMVGFAEMDLEVEEKDDLAVVKAAMQRTQNLSCKLYLE
jgi:hypothetical protein